MNRRLWKFTSAAALLCAFVLFGQASASAQQQQGRAAGGNGSAGLNQAMGRTSDVALGRGNGRVVVGGPSSFPSPSSPSVNRPSYEYAVQARIRAENERHADKELREHPDMPARLNTTAEELREGYREMHRYNIFLTFEQYVTAVRLAANLIPTHPKITRTGLLNGIAAGKSFERTLVDRGLTKEEAKAAVQRVKQEIKESRRRS